MSPRRPRLPAPLRDRRVLALSTVLVVLLAAVGVVLWQQRDDSAVLDAPGGIEARPAEGQRPAATVSFATVEGAEAYMLRFDDEAADPIRVESSLCHEGRCELTFDHMSAGEAGSVTVTALGVDGTSGASQEVALPEWPTVEDQASGWPEDGPVPLVVTRRGPDGRPEYETEVIEAGPDVQQRVEARIAELEGGQDVVDVTVDLPVQLGRASQASGRIPEGLPTWQTLAWDYDSLPSDLDGSGVIVAVIDSAFDLDHPALQGADIGPVVNVGDPDMSNDEALEALGEDHGTATTSMIVGQSGSGITGIAPRATIRPYSIYTDDLLEFLFRGEAILASDLADSIVQAVDDGADVVTMSLSVSCSGTGPHRFCPEGTLAPAVEYAESHGAVVLAAAPNDGDPRCDDATDGETNQDAWPAMLDSVVAVGGAREDGSRFACSPQREYVDVLAPARRLQVAAMDGYPVWSGTSFATPLTAGLVALVRQAEPDMTPAEVRSLLNETKLDDGRIIPLDVMERLGRLDEAATTAADTYLLADAVVRDADWPYRGAALSLDASPQDGAAATVLGDVLGEPAATDPASWGSGQGSDDPRPVPGDEGAPDPPECWSGLYGLALWQEDGAPLLGALYARQELPLDSGEPVPAGALLGYRVFRDSARVRMADGIAIGGTQAELEAFYQQAGQPSREVSFVDDGGEFELVATGSANPTTPGPTGPAPTQSPGPDLGRISGQGDPDGDRILERGAGSQCGLDVETVSALLGVEPPGDGDGGGGGGGGGGDDTAECARVGVVLDASPSIVDAGAEGQVREAATGVVDALADSGAEVRISAFAGFPVSLTSGWLPLSDEEGHRLARQVVGAMAFEGTGTNWEAALMDMAGQSADVVVLVTDGNPNEYGVGITSSPSPDWTVDFDPVALAAGVSAAGILRDQGARVIAVGAGAVRGDSLAQVAGPTEGEDYYTGDFSDLGPSLAEIVSDLCGTG